MLDQYFHKKSQDLNNNGSRWPMNRRYLDYKCTKCYIKFDSFDELKTNELTHTTSGINEVTWDKNKNTIIPTNNKNIKPFSFVTCDKEFDKFNDLKRHKRTYIEKPFSFSKMGLQVQ